MGALAASNITTTLLNRRRNNGRSYFNCKLAFGNGSTLTYPANGVPVTAATFGFPNTIESVNFYDVGASGYVWQYDATHSTIRAFESRDQDWAALAGITSSWIANTTVTGQVRYSGDTAQFQVNLALAGAPTSAALTVTLPAAPVVDTTKLVSANADAQIVGYGGFKHSAVNGSFIVTANVTAAQQVDVWFVSSISTAALTAVDATHTETWANGDEVNLFFTLPVTGYAGNQLNGNLEMLTGSAPAAQTLKCEAIGW